MCDSWNKSIYIPRAYSPRDVYGLIPPFSVFISYLTANRETAKNKKKKNSKRQEENSTGFLLANHDVEV